MAGYKVIRLQAENVKRLSAIDITPGGGVVTIGGKNAAGKSSVLDSIFMAAGGLDAAPPRPVRAGQDRATIKVALGRGDETELTIVRTFDADGATSLRVETADGAKYSSPQKLLDGMLGALSFDPLEFTQMSAKDQVAELRKIVTIDVDLDEYAKRDKEATAARRDLNRDAAALKPRIEAISVVEGLPDTAPDRDAILDQLRTAADTNTALERESLDRIETARVAKGRRDHAAELRDKAEQKRLEAERLIAEAAQIDKSAQADIGDAERLESELAALPPIADKVDTQALTEQLAKADRITGMIATRDQRKALVDEQAAIQAQADELTRGITERAAQRAAAMAKAEMPVPGLSIETGDEMLVAYNGVPFEQASQAEQLRVSTAIAMAANPKLRVLRIREGALLDNDGLAIVAEMAKAGDFQIWLELVGDGTAQIIIENGAVRGADVPESLADEGPKRRAKKEAEPAADTTAPTDRLL